MTANTRNGPDAFESPSSVELPEPEQPARVMTPAIVTANTAERDLAIVFP
jgi:hypothetical protein